MAQPHLDEDYLTTIAQHPEWAAVPRLYWVLRSIDRTESISAFLAHDVTDFWFPFQQQSLRHFFPDASDQRLFLKAQNAVTLQEWPSWEPDRIAHLSFEDGDTQLQTGRVLGEGAFGLVEEVVIPADYYDPAIVCVRKKIERVKQLKRQKEILKAFEKEVKVMRQVHHYHCVELVVSYTDLTTVAIFSLPVADMDLATFLDLEDSSVEYTATLYGSMACLCAGLAYLHKNKIRHEDLKPQNVLVKGYSRFLLTDFGFSLDFSEDSVSTTTGRPSHWTARYTAPEVMNYEPRNRSTDIWSLGCIFIEMLSRIRGHSLSHMKTFWRESGNSHPSFALNDKATHQWFQRLGNNNHDDGNQYLLALLKAMVNPVCTRRPNAADTKSFFANVRLIFPDLLPYLVCKSCSDGDPRMRQIRLALSPANHAFFYPAALPSTVVIIADVDLHIVSRHDRIPSDLGLLRIFGTDQWASDLLQDIKERFSSPRLLREQDDPDSLALMSNMVSPLDVRLYYRQPSVRMSFRGLDGRVQVQSMAVQISLVPMWSQRGHSSESKFLQINIMPEDETIKTWSYGRPALSAYEERVLAALDAPL